MPLHSLTDLLLPALRQGYAVPAFNVVDSAMMAGVVDAAEQAASPIIVQISERTARSVGPRILRAMFDGMISESGATASLHLDHCGDGLFVESCLRAGWNSALFDVSHLPYAEALQVTTKMVRTAQLYSGEIEGEFERTGHADAAFAVAQRYPVADSLRFIRESGVASFSPAVGTLHGRYTAVPQLDFNRISELVRETAIPQVLHGASGLNDETLRELVGSGIAKVNFSTVLKGVHTEAARAHTAVDGPELEPLSFIQDVRRRVAKVANHYVGVLGSSGKAA